jgi:hypothetical protein
MRPTMPERTDYVLLAEVSIEAAPVIAAAYSWEDLSGGGRAELKIRILDPPRVRARGAREGHHSSV